MKFVLIISAILIAVYGNPIQPKSSELNAESLKNTAKNVLDAVRNLQTDLDDIEHDAELTVGDILKEHPLVKKTKAAFQGALAALSITADCAAKVEDQFSKLVKTTTKTFENMITVHIVQNQGFFEFMRGLLGEIEDNLEHHLGEEIQQCLTDEKQCKITDKYIEATDFLFRVVDEGKYELFARLKNQTEILKSDEQSPMIVDEFLIPISDCLVAE